MAAANFQRAEILIDGRPAPVIARVNRRAKRLILKVDAARGEILITAPSERALPEALAFARERADWIAAQMKDALRARAFVAGGTAPVRGARRRIVLKGGPRAPVRLGEADGAPAVFIGGDEAHLNRRLIDWLKRQARADLIARCDDHCRALGARRGAIRIRDTRSRWGSCSSTGTLSFSWRLVMAPPWVLDYVAAHECAHLLHMNHSPAFWRAVRTLGVDARGAERWFREHGARLFAYGTEP